MTARRPTQSRRNARDAARPIPTSLGPIEEIPIGRLRQYDRNARTHSSKQVAKIAASIETFGWTNPIIAERDGTIIAGHGRWMAAKSLKLATVPVVWMDHLTPEKIKVYRIADNRLAELAGWDDEMLKIEFGELLDLDLDFSIEVAGFDHAQIDVIIDPPPAKGQGEGPLDPADKAVPGPASIAVSQSGDIWSLGDHRLGCGSILDAAFVEKLMNGKKAVMVFSDPPYNCNIDGNVTGAGAVKHREFEMASGEMTPAEFRRFLLDSTLNMSRHLKSGGIAMLCMDWRNLHHLMVACGEVGLELLNIAVWAKTNAGMGSLYRSQHEMVVVAKKGRAKHINNVELGRHKRYRTNVWTYPGINSFGRGRMDQLKVHPTVKPIALVADAIRDVSNRGDIVLDGFMGSGTTLLAAERTGRIGYGMDIDPLYVDVGIRRWQEMTGGKAVLTETGETFDAVLARRTVGQTQAA
ncbi:site-specific DNA-methyltransferase [Sphingomonas montanisoli]|uniref:Methyltransferase n=2 Tax=Sphingomonas montanisoli TaxID=2606412 RepID=A0A5D9C5Z5_9SPHN|nr:site-specific DNA-methyltransferase [Sphingomonas montanisoli]